ncbi:MAG TPA: leucyl aminopeptidase family protein [Phycisphaerales bacterium]|nr:leucyl aminopeptidase family protein [Phycisphaerales bacterium]
MFESISVGGKGKSEVLVLGVFQPSSLKDRPTLDRQTASIDPSGAASEALKRPEAGGEAGSVIEAYVGKALKTGHTRVWILGLGKKENLKPDVLRTAAANLGRRLAAAKSTSVDIEILAQCAAARIDATTAGVAVGEGLGLIGWMCDDFRGTGVKAPERRKLAVRGGGERFINAVDRGLALAESTNFTRTLSQTPPNIATTGFMAECARKLAKECGLGFKLFEGDALVREKFEGLINVGKASENKPCMVRLEYKPRSAAKNAKPLVLVGKTMTYDTGGLSLKINNGMVGMKRDKDGGCAVLGAMHAIATVIKPRVPVVALLSIAENSISDEAYRPDDVITYRNGVTVEVTNTDAEGRLVLADALCWACEQENPAAIVDLATLTGGVVVALGSTYCGMFCEDDRLRGKVETAAQAAGERVWRLPMHEEYRELMKSPVADILNSNPNRKAHPIQGAAFLSYFVKENIPWCHLDIAGVHVSDGNKGCYIDGPTGWGVRTLANLVDQW